MAEAQKVVIYRLDWNPTPISVVLLFAIMGVVVYAPSFIRELPFFCNPWIGLIAQIAWVVAAAKFFYYGLSRRDQTKVILLLVALVSLLGLISNLFYDATILLSTKTLASDPMILGLMNFGAVAVTLSCYRISQTKVDFQDAPEEVKAASKIRPWWMKITPLAFSLIFLVASIILLLNNKFIPPDSTFAIAIPAFICGQMLLNVGGTMYMFKSRGLAERIKLGFITTSLAMILGTIGNINNGLTELWPGNRVAFTDTSDFIVMNAGALLVVVSYFYWKKFLGEQEAKFLAKEAEAAQASPPPETPSFTPASPEALEAKAAKSSSDSTKETTVDSKETAPTAPLDDEDKKEEGTNGNGNGASNDSEAAANQAQNNNKTKAKKKKQSS